MISYRVQPLDSVLHSAYRALLPLQEPINSSGKLDWKFAQRANSEGFAAIAERDGHIVGFSTYMPVSMQLKRQRRLAFQAIDSIVDPAARGQGVFTQLARTFGEHQQTLGFDGIWGFPNANAAPAWFGKLGWTRLGLVPFLIKPLRAGYFLRRLKIPLDFSMSFAKDQNADTIKRFDDSVSSLWERVAFNVDCSVIRCADYLNWRIFDCPTAEYRTVATHGTDLEAFVTTTVMQKHGGKIGYVMEALGADSALTDLLNSEIGRFRNNGVEIVLAWCFPWSPNYRAFRAAGFSPLPPTLRPIKMYFGGRAYSAQGAPIIDLKSWYLSYLDSDTV